MGLFGMGFVLCSCAVIIFWGVKLFYKILLRPKILEKNLRKQANLFVVPYKPPYGNIKEMREMAIRAFSKPMQLNHDIAPRLDPFLQQQLTATPKKLVVVWYGGNPNVVVMDPKLIKEILTKKFEFKKPEISPTMKFFLKGLANIDGDKWAMHRKIINPAFHLEKLKGMLPFFMESCEHMIGKWEKLLGSKDLIELDVLPEFQNLTGDIISRAAFGSNIEEGKFVFSLQREQAQYLFQSLVSMSSPWSRFLISKLEKKMMQIHKEVQHVLEGIIKKRERSIQSGNADQNDLLNLLLKSNFNEIEKNKVIGMSREDVIEECKLFYFAGHETSANLLTWTMIVLSMHQNWQQMARNEVFQLIGKERPSFDDLNRFKIVNMILLEVLRLYPPTALVRSIKEDVKLGECTFPSGVMFTIPTYLIHRNPEIWGENANEFNPDRFSDGISKATKDPSCFFAFGWGPRVCIGQNFAMLEAKLALVLILQHFSFHLSSSYKHSPRVFLTLQPQFGAQIILEKI